MFHSQHCKHLHVCADKIAGAPTAFLPRTTSPIVEFQPSPSQPALQMETRLTSSHQLPIWLILLNDQGKSSLFSTASFIPFPSLSFCLVVPPSPHSCLPSFNLNALQFAACLWAMLPEAIPASCVCGPCSIVLQNALFY